MANPLDLCTLSDVKVFLKISNANVSEDALIESLITSTSVFFNNYCSRILKAADYNLTFNGNGKTLIMLKDYPINSVASLTINGENIPAYTFGAGVGYNAINNSVTVYGRSFVKGYQNINIQFNAGYTSVPFDLKQACVEVVAMRYKERDRFGEVSQSIGDQTLSYLIADMPPSVKTILNDYRRVATLADV